MPEIIASRRLATAMSSHCRLFAAHPTSKMPEIIASMQTSYSYVLSLQVVRRPPWSARPVSRGRRNGQPRVQGPDEPCHIRPVPRHQFARRRRFERLHHGSYERSTCRPTWCDDDGNGGKCSLPDAGPAPIRATDEHVPLAQCSLRVLADYDNID